MPTSALRWSLERRRRAELTPLNEATTAKYLRCHRTHVASGKTVLRNFPGGDRLLPLCARCGVPFGAPKVKVWSSR